MGPGRANEHVDQRVVASWDGCPEVHQPSLRADGGFDVAGVVAELSDPAVAAGVSLTPPAAGRPRQGPVWHCSLRCAPEDPGLSDEQWSQVVEDLMDRTGIARCGDPDGCRWVAIRHADDHVHVAAVLVGQVSGRRVAPFRDFVRARETCQVWEERLGVVRTAGADRSSVTGPSRAELEKAARLGQEGPSREWLRRQVRAAVVQARDAESFMVVLSRRGVSVRPRYAVAGDRGSGVVGYAVSVPGIRRWRGGRCGFRVGGWRRICRCRI
ncbi:relaxase/mobilization nuclease domain-containing protein [Pseudonocardia sp. ICBG1293]|uniref:relaxase/mobilization nuclease domain-containing protein n=1 Tax=Pseudonocardia sp. ICBG1293 TaxID=2844382 RepID=UPI0035A83BCA